MKLKFPIRELHRSERKLAHHLNVVATRHHSDQDVNHLAQDLAGWSQQHLSELAKQAATMVCTCPPSRTPARSPDSCNPG